MPPSVTKLSVSVPRTLADSIRRRAGSRGISAFIVRAAAHELEREQLTTWLDGLDAELGPVPPRALAAARRAWPKR